MFYKLKEGAKEEEFRTRIEPAAEAHCQPNTPTPQPPNVSLTDQSTGSKNWLCGRSKTTVQGDRLRGGEVKKKKKGKEPNRAASQGEPCWRKDRTSCQVHMNTHARTHARMHGRVRARAHTHTHTHTHTQTHTHTNTHTHTQTHAHIHACSCVYTDITFTHTHVQTRVLKHCCTYAAYCLLILKN